ncbi:MAG TPA: hypothetical protein VHE60_10370 [Pyrinomonadaceae bacterium]|nr:hypothetical protein [Pyrinomonadaceae bacterium]
MVRLLTQMMRLPGAVLVYSVEMFAKTMQGLQRITDQGIDAIVGNEAQAGRLTGGDQARSPPPTTIFNESATTGRAENSNTVTPKEESKMSDVDLRGDDSKLVAYFITFTKRDLGAYLGGDSEVISYSTTEADYGGAKKAEYLADLQNEGAKRSDKWKTSNYPPDKYLDPGDKDRFIGLPPEDFEEFVKVKVEVKARYETEPGQYEKEQADALKKLASAVKDGVIQTT